MKLDVKAMALTLSLLWALAVFGGAVLAWFTLAWPCSLAWFDERLTRHGGGFFQSHHIE